MRRIIAGELIVLCAFAVYAMVWYEPPGAIQPVICVAGCAESARCVCPPGSTAVEGHDGSDGCWARCEPDGITVSVDAVRNIDSNCADGSCSRYAQKPPPNWPYPDVPYSRETEDARLRVMYPIDSIVMKPGRLVCELPAEEKLAIRQIVEEEIEAALRRPR